VNQTLSHYEAVSTVGYSVVSVLEQMTACIHVSRLKAIPDSRDDDASDPEQGLWPDVLRVLRDVLGKRTVRDGVMYQVRRADRNGFLWADAEDLPDVIVNAYEMSRGE
jgi:hypothetical protein